MFPLKIVYQNLTWHDARQQCLNEDMILWEITTQKDFGFAKALYRDIGPFWVGGSDLGNEKVWLWNSTGDEIRLDRFWNSLEPNGHEKRDEDCLEVNYSGLNDALCSIQQTLVCR